MARHPLFVLSAFTPLALALAACSGGDDGTPSASFLETCSGAYTCIIDGDVVDGSLHEVDGICSLGGVELYSNGSSAPIDGKPVTWTGDASRIEICQASICFQCYGDNPSTSGPSTTKGQCTGSAWSCSSVGASSCSDQGGCYYTVGATLSTSDDGCAGTPRDCDDYSSQDRCNGQRGCSWK